MKDVIQASPQSLALGMGCTPCSLSGWVELLPEYRDHLRAQSQMRPTILLWSIFCWSLVNSLWLRLVPDSRPQTACVYTFLTKTKECAGCVCVVESLNGILGGNLQEGNLTPLLLTGQRQKSLFSHRRHTLLLSLSRARTWPDPDDAVSVWR